MMRIMKRNDPHNQPSQPYKLQQISRVNKIAHENTKIMEENKGLFLFYFRYIWKVRAAKADNFE